MPDLVQIMKRAAVEAVEAGKPACFLYGNVVSKAPLKIQVDQKLTLDETYLVLSRNVTDYTVDITAAHQTEPAGEHTHSHLVSTPGGVCASDANTEPAHIHAYKGRKSIVIHNALQAGERVILARMQGGQRFIVLDRVGV